MNGYISLLLFAFFFPFCNSSEQKSEYGIYQGVYFDYPETEYERSFLICDTGELWRIGQGGEYTTLQKIYNRIEHSTHGEIFIEIRARVSLIDIKKYSKSHFVANAEIQEILRYSSDTNQIKKCIKKSKIDSVSHD
ncbi:MAG: hypothetical protein D6732_17405 [Methanobacteriota archaeon]|nr:MAG: hypothetical protein D6732_17405 [Euryarchaeota archaeon]